MTSQNVAAAALRLHIEAIERLESEKQGISEDVKERYSLAKGEGYCPKTLRKVVRLRKMEKHDRDEASALLATYCAALGMQGSFDV